MTIQMPPRGLTMRDLARLEDERNELQNSFGGSAWTDGLIEQRLKYIDRVIAAGCQPPPAEAE